MLFSAPDSKGGPRVRMTVWASFDRGETWPVKRLVHEGPSAYSSLAAGKDGDLYLLFERGKKKLYESLAVARFSLEWLTEERDWRLKKDPEKLAVLADKVMAMSEQHVVSLIDDKHGTHIPIPCPKCKGYQLELDLGRPHRLTCRECSTAVSESTLPPTGSTSGKNGLGETVTYTFHQGARNKLYLAAGIRYRRHHRLAEACRALGHQYQVTRHERYARRAAVILDRLAAAYPRWPVMEVTKPRSYRWKLTLGPTRPYTHWGVSRWAWLFMYEIPQDCVFAYDLTYASPQWDQLSKERGYDARRRVEDGFFRPACRFAVQAHEDMGGRLKNLDPTLYQRMIHLGRVLNDPDLIHQAVKWMGDMVRTSYHFDGMEYEGAITYHGVVTGRLGIAARALRGYTDPPGYVDERFGMRLKNAEFGSQFPIHAKAWRVWSMMRFPNGNTVCIHDTNWSEGRCATPADAEATNIELNAYGHFALGRGRGPDAMQAHLHFGPRSSGAHFHVDRLGIILWGAGEEMLSDVGYVNVGKRHRYFVNRAICHNTVQVSFDEPPAQPKLEEPADLPRDPVACFKAVAESRRDVVDARSRLLAYDPGTVSGKHVQLVEASSPGPEWMRVPMRRRALLMIGVGDNRSYIVDLFRVAGGSQHQFVLRPSVDEDVSSECSLSLTPRKGTLAGEDVPYGQIRKGVAPYSWLVHDLKTCTTDGPWRLTWRGQGSGASIRGFFRGQARAEVILAQSPTLRRGKQDSRLADEFQGPHLVVRHRGPTGLRSVFAGVYDCWRDGKSALVDRVEWIALPDEANAIALSVRLGQREDLVYASLDGRRRTVRGVRFAGRFAVLSRRGGQASWAWAHDAWPPGGRGTPPALRGHGTSAFA